MKRLFVTGTDTGVGKTTVACALAAAWRAEGRRVATLKPSETGCDDGPDGLVPSDALLLAAAAGEALPPARTLAAICPNRFALPASPEAAAAAIGQTVDLAAIHAAANDRAGAEVLLIEGAGGLLVPITSELLQVDLAASLDAPLLVIARDALGTVNHTLLTLEVARRRGLRVVGVVLHATSSAPGPDSATNREAITRHGAVTVFGTLPWAENPTLATLAQLARTHLDREALWRAL